MNFSALSIKNPAPAIMLFILLCVLGLISFRANTVQNLPDIELPYVLVDAALEGTAPAQMETEVARKLEDAVATLAGVKHVTTSVMDSVVHLQIAFNLEKDPNEAVTDVRDAVERVRADLPSDMRAPSVTKMGTTGRVVMYYSASATTLDEQDLSWFVDNTLAKRLLAVKGVGAVQRAGGVTREIAVELDPARMQAHGVSAIEVSRLLHSVQQNAPSGRSTISGSEQTLRTIATVKTVAELAAMELPLADGHKVRLDQIASVRDDTAERHSLALVNGKAVVGVEILRAKGASEMDLAAGVKEAVAALQQEFPGIKLQLWLDNSTQVENNFNDSLHLLYEGAILAVLVVWWFLRDWRATLIAAAALPLSVIPAFIGMQYLGFTLNTVTLVALALVIGILVDDAIVEIENIIRHLQDGKSPLQAATEAADEIGMAVIATTFALVAVFLPTAFMGGIPGKVFKQFGWTAVLAIMASLLVARLLTPMMAAYMLKPMVARPRHDSRLMLWYMRAVKWCLHHRFATCAIATVFFVASVSLVGMLNTGFIPAADHGQTQVSIELPPGSSLQATSAMAERVRQVATSLPQVKTVLATIGGGSSGDLYAPSAAAEKRRAILTLIMSERRERKESLKDLEEQLRVKLAELPGARFQVELRTLKGVGAVSSSASLVNPEVLLQPDFARAADLGVTASSIGETLRVATAGDYDTNLPKLNLNERQVPIRVKLPNSIQADLAALEKLTVPGKNGPVALNQVASLRVDSGPAQIDRLDRARNVTLTVELGQTTLGEANAAAMQLPSLKNLPPSVSIFEAGQTQDMAELFASFGIAMVVGIFCIYGVLVLLFKDFMQPITILAALPLSIGGAFSALLITNSELSMPALIGLIMLMGVVSKNSILLVEYTIVARQHGMSRFDALIDACHKRSRPIVMTTVAMGAGMLPTALGFSAEPSFRSPMAIAILGGLITSTLLSLLVVPVVFGLVDDVENTFARWFGRKK
ncbi:MAG: efflux RND transporter permease subunit [Burkholderiales bacterium]|nr:efflux RND transporter permease subunit [Burkholderiales bacterium]